MLIISNIIIIYYIIRFRRQAVLICTREAQSRTQTVSRVSVRDCAGISRAFVLARRSVVPRPSTSAPVDRDVVQRTRKQFIVFLPKYHQYRTIQIENLSCYFIIWIIYGVRNKKLLNCLLKKKTNVI